MTPSRTAALRTTVRPAEQVGRAPRRRGHSRVVPAAKCSGFSGRCADRPLGGGVPWHHGLQARPLYTPLYTTLEGRMAEASPGAATNGQLVGPPGDPTAVPLDGSRHARGGPGESALRWSRHGTRTATRARRVTAQGWPR